MSNGFILIDKAIGVSSAKALYPIKKTLPKGCKIGHAGTLDPFASGLLIAGIGKATKAIEYIMGMDKVYEFTVKWGESTDTDDLTGKIINQSNKIPSQKEIEGILPEFHGAIAQVPPIYSAISIGGKRSYDMARNGENVVLKPRNINVKSIKITDHNIINTSFIIECSKGCYVRSIARDIAMKLETYSYVTQLRRTKIGSFSVDDASDKIIPTIKIFDHYKQIYLDDNTAQKFINGIKTTLTDLQEFLLINHKYDLMIIGHNINGELKLKRIS